MANTSGRKRLRFDRTTLHEEADGQCRAEVFFTFGGQPIRSSAIEANEGKSPLKAAARATLKAIEQAVEGRFRCSLVDLDHVNALGKDLIAVLVEVSFEGRNIQVFGSCQKGESEIDSAVKAALNATNRFVELAMRG
ncbi:MAG TPA: hypothetical protein VNN73_13930 [Blastocatellia bacterium]|nr:hypothetical protein [Blastocatellia bacterium]